MIRLDHAMLVRRVSDLTRRIAARTFPWTEYHPGLHGGRLGNLVLFAGEWLRGPAAVGAVCSSSRWLAREIARHVPAGGGLVVELGAGTGIVTQALLERGISPGRLIAIERSEAFVAHLRRRFPGITVICGDAAQLDGLIPEGLRIDALVSSLPLRSLPLPERRRILDQWDRALDADSMLIQFTYDIRPQTRTCSCDQAFEVRNSRIVWANLPPARVLLARRAGRRRPPP
ncbi:class I SAM-dependent methyltransferase [Castellaniella sp. S9]|uniref:class I SAM-dependent methyltransferase n=1 Tax=Castellaniella sp. S9 TaxID=2993652 RepID=UPI0022B33D2F|nr:methyltransferase domain-containing protein [Castellaniella sp. S9]